MIRHFTGFPVGQRGTIITVIWADGVFTAPDAVSEPFARRCADLAVELQDRWAIAPGLPAQPPGNHSLTPIGAWFLVGKVMQIDSVTGDEEPSQPAGPLTFVV